MAKGVEYGEFVMEVVKPFIDQEYRTLADREHTGHDWIFLRGKYYPILGIRVPRSNQLFRGLFHPLTGYTKMPSIIISNAKKLYVDQRIYIYVGTEEADDTDKTLMAGNIKQAYIDSSLRYYHDVIQQGVAF